MKNVLKENEVLKFGVKTAWHSVMRLYYNYDDHAMEAIEKIQFAYTTYCLPSELNHASSTLEKEENEKSHKKLPLFFQMKTPEKQPCVIDYQFAPNDNQQIFINEINKTSSKIQSEIIQLISIICAYQEQRAGRSLGGKGYSYDPTNLFLEEFKLWLVHLSRSELNNETLDVVINRKQYLENLIDIQVFSLQERPVLEYLKKQIQNFSNIKLEIYEYSAMQLVVNMADQINNIVIPAINLIIEKQRAREHFEALAREGKKILIDSLEYLFHVFRDTPNATRNININTIRQPILPYDVKCICHTLSGQLLQILCSTEEFIAIFPRTKLSKRFTEENNTGNNDHVFLKHDFTPQYPMLSVEPNKTQIHRFNWYDNKITEQQSGVLEVFCKRELMDDYLIMLGVLQKIALFHIIADRFSELAGEGGEILVFGYLLATVETAIKTYEKCLKTLKSILNKFKMQSWEHQLTLVQRSHTINESEKAWLSRRELTNIKYHALLKSIDVCHDYLRKVNVRMDIVKDHNYIKELEEKIFIINELVTKFSGQNTIANMHDSCVQTKQVNFNREDSSKEIEAKRTTRLIASYPGGRFLHSTHIKYNELSEIEYQIKFEKAADFYRQKKLSESEILYEELLQNKTDDCDLRIHYSEILISMESLSKAEQAIEILSPIIEKTLAGVTEIQLRNALLYRSEAKEKINDIQGAENDLILLIETFKEQVPRNIKDKYRNVHGKVIAMKLSTS